MTTVPNYASGRPDDLYYRHSGMIPISGVLLTLIGGLVVAVLGGIVYAYAVRWIRFIYIRALSTIAFGGLVGFVTGKLARAGKLRNVKVTLVLVAIVTLVGYYFAWMFWIAALHDDISTMRLLVSPRAVWDVIGLINEVGTWSMKRSDPVNGTALTVVWLIEAGLIFGFAMFGATGALGGDMYCETCERWTPGGDNFRRTATADPATARQRLEAHDFAWIDTLPPVPDQTSSWWTFSHRRCPSCENLHSLSVIETAIATDNKGNTQTKTTKIVNELLITPQEAQALLAAASPPPVAPPPVPPPPAP